MNDADCLFCKIVRGEIPSRKLYEDGDVVAFEDIQPQAPTHFLVIPKRHIPTLDDVKEGDEALVGRVLTVASRLAREKGLADDGYRQIINCGKYGGQIVFHLHAHVVGGRQLGKMG